MKKIVSIKFLACSIVFSFILTPLESRAADQRVLHGHVPPAVARLGLQLAGRLPATNLLHLAIGLPLRNREALTNLLQQIYDPTSPNYRHYLTPQQFTEQFGPTELDYQTVINFAKTNGLEVRGTSGNRVVLDVSGRVADIERAFRVNLRTYQHPTEARQFFTPDVEPSVDASVPILDISGLDNYILPHSMLHRKSSTGNATPAAATGSGPSDSYIGKDFRTAYAPGVALDGTGQSVGLVDYTNGYYKADITNYVNTATAGQSIPPSLVNVLLDDAPETPSGDTTEASLDIEMAISMAPNLSSVVVFEGDTWDDILNTMAASNQIKQFSSSWSFGGPDYTSDQILQELATQGQSFFMASGDGDAWVNNIDYVGGWPSDDPWVTTVGGTSLTMTGLGASYASEIVWNWGYDWPGWGPNGNGYVGSGGGVSTTYPITTWQQSTPMTTNQGSTIMRNIPDVALTADNVYCVYNNGVVGTDIGGTSCAAPLWAGFTALVNQRAALLDPPTTVGFLNPAIYAIGNSPIYLSCFHDITAGNNFSASSPTNYPAVPGYDLCTGWGTPNGSNLINALVATNISVPASPCFFTIYVSGASGPWNVTNNPTYRYGQNGSLPPSVVDSSSGLAFVPKANLLIRSLTPGISNLLAGNSGTLWSDANGVTWGGGGGRSGLLLPGGIYGPTSLP